MSLSLYNTLSRQKETFVPLTAQQVRMYVCGMTVYDYCHLGHARVMVVFDVVQRWLKTSGYAGFYIEYEKLDLAFGPLNGISGVLSNSSLH